VNHPIPRRKAWDGRRAAPCVGPDPFELSRQLAEEEATAMQRAEEAATEQQPTPENPVPVSH